MRIKHYWQRATRGYSDEDLWGFQDYLSVMIPSALRRLKEMNSSCPSDLYDEKKVNDEFHKWNEILEEIAQGFEATKNPDCMYWDKAKEGYMEMKYDKKKSAQQAKKFERGMDLFKEYYYNLWD